MQLAAASDARLAITDAMFRYCRLIDSRSIDAFIDVFTDDCVVNYSRKDLHGKAEVRAFVDKFIGEMVQATHHQIGNVEIDLVDDDHATAVSYVTAWHRFLAERPDYLVYGAYHDQWRRQGSSWFLAERRIHINGEVKQARI